MDLIAHAKQDILKMQTNNAKNVLFNARLAWLLVIIAQFVQQQLRIHQIEQQYLFANAHNFILMMELIQHANNVLQIVILAKLNQVNVWPVEDNTEIQIHQNVIVLLDILKEIK